MKFLALSAMILSFSAMAACPDLSGTYASCRSNTGEVNQGPTISQNISNGVTTYTVVSIDPETGLEITESYIADGLLRVATETDAETGMTLSMGAQATCTGNALSINVQVASQDQEFANLNLKVTKVGGQMTTVTNGTTMGETVNEIEVCE